MSGVTDDRDMTLLIMCQYYTGEFNNNIRLQDTHRLCNLEEIIYIVEFLDLDSVQVSVKVKFFASPGLSEPKDQFWSVCLKFGPKGGL